jgi:translation elongation factor EF-1alpha
VPSIHNNKTSFLLNGKRYQMIDYIGDNISKEDLLSTLDQIHTIVHVIDGSDEKGISDAAMFMDRVLVCRGYQKKECNYLVFLNKNDLPEYIGHVRFQQKLEDEI